MSRKRREERCFQVNSRTLANLMEENSLFEHSFVDPKFTLCNFQDSGGSIWDRYDRILYNLCWAELFQDYRCIHGKRYYSDQRVISLHFQVESDNRPSLFIFRTFGWSMIMPVKSSIRLDRKHKGDIYVARSLWSLETQNHIRWNRQCVGIITTKLLMIDRQVGNLQLKRRCRTLIGWGGYSLGIRDLHDFGVASLSLSFSLSAWVSPPPSPNHLRRATVLLRLALEEWQGCH